MICFSEFDMYTTRDAFEIVRIHKLLLYALSKTIVI